MTKQMKEASSQEETNLLAKRIQKGDIKAFDLLYERFSERLFSFAFSMLKNREDAKEIVQETFLKVWNKRSQINTSQSIKAYLFSISYNVTIDILRARLKEDKYREYIQNQFIVGEPGAENMADFNELSETVQKAIEELPEQRKKIYLLSREEGLSHKEIAENLNISVKTVENQINLALKIIRKKLNSGNLLSLLFTALFL